MLARRGMVQRAVAYLSASRLPFFKDGKSSQQNRMFCPCCCHEEMESRRIADKKVRKDGELVGVVAKPHLNWHRINRSTVMTPADDPLCV